MNECIAQSRAKRYLSFGILSTRVLWCRQVHALSANIGLILNCMGFIYVMSIVCHIASVSIWDLYTLCLYIGRMVWYTLPVIIFGSVFLCTSVSPDCIAQYKLYLLTYKRPGHDGKLHPHFNCHCSFLYWCVMRPASKRFFIHSCFYLRLLIVSYLSTFLGTNSLSVLMCRKAVNQSILTYDVILLYDMFNVSTVFCCCLLDPPPTISSGRRKSGLTPVFLHFFFANCMSWTHDTD